MFGSSRSADDVRYCDTPTNFASSRFGQSNQRPFNSSRYGSTSSSATSNAHIQSSRMPFKSSQNTIPFGISSSRIRHDKLMADDCGFYLSKSAGRENPLGHRRKSCFEAATFNSSKMSTLGQQEFNASRNFASSKSALKVSAFRTSRYVSEPALSSSNGSSEAACAPKNFCGDFGSFYNKKKHNNKRQVHMSRILRSAMNDFFYKG